MNASCSKLRSSPVTYQYQACACICGLRAMYVPTGGIAAPGPRGRAPDECPRPGPKLKYHARGVRPCPWGRFRRKALQLACGRAQGTGWGAHAYMRINAYVYVCLQLGLCVSISFKWGGSGTLAGCSGRRPWRCLRRARPRGRGRRLGILRGCRAEPSAVEFENATVAATMHIQVYCQFR